MGTNSLYVRSEIKSEDRCLEFAGRHPQKGIDLCFLDEGKNYVAEIYTDGGPQIKTRTKVKVSKFRVNSKMNLSFNLKASGGAAIRLVPEKQGNMTIKNYKNQVL